MSSEAHGGLAFPDPGRPGGPPMHDFGRDCVISRHDLEILLRGAESEKEIGYRNLFAGIAASSGFGILSTIGPRLGELASAGVEPLESILLILLIAVTLASGALAVFFHRRLKVTGAGGAYRVLDRHIRTQLEHPTELDDPRHWP